jgi:hypothetical protein
MRKLHELRVVSRLLELARVLVRLDHVARIIVNANNEKGVVLNLKTGRSEHLNRCWPGKLDRDHNLSPHLQLLRSDVAPNGDAACRRSNPRGCRELVEREQIEAELGGAD